VIQRAYKPFQYLVFSYCCISNGMTRPDKFHAACTWHVVAGIRISTLVVFTMDKADVQHANYVQLSISLLRSFQC
jgi:hypothetical protein